MLVKKKTKKGEEQISNKRIDFGLYLFSGMFQENKYIYILIPTTIQTR